ncbi:MAG: ethylbenzene dehydrogenase-related protein [Acidobacteriota bacterium]
MARSRSHTVLCAAAFGATWLLAGCGTAEKHAAASLQDVQAVPCAGELPRTDPDAPAWQSAPEYVATLMPQDQTEPKLTTPGVPTVRVRALHDGAFVAFRLEWDDPTKDELAGVGKSSDAVAVQVPVGRGGDVPDGAMGQAGRPVRITLWKAAWQAALGSKEDAVSRLYPNARPDHYPFDAAAPSARAAMEALYAPARALGNPVTVRRTDSPTQDLAAEGFGSLTAQPDQVSVGAGLHDGRRWRVTIARPLDADENGALRAGNRTYAAFAVWNGTANEAGARKMRSGWIPLAIAARGETR